MLDALSIHVGGNSNGRPFDAEGNISPAPVRRAPTPRVPVTEETKLARKYARHFNTLDELSGEFSGELWEVTNDAQKAKIFEFIQGFLEEGAFRDAHGNLHGPVQENIAYVYREWTDPR